MRKQCTKCLSVKETKHFSKRNRSKDGLNHWCKNCVIENNKKWQNNNKEKVKQNAKAVRDRYPDKIIEKELKYKFDMTLQKYDDLLKSQNNSCAICGTHQSVLKTRLAVDHCHLTNKIRGLLCGPCNRALGIMKDSIILLENAIDYLKK